MSIMCIVYNNIVRKRKDYNQPSMGRFLPRHSAPGCAFVLNKQAVFPFCFKLLIKNIIFRFACLNFQTLGII